MVAGPTFKGSLFGYPIRHREAARTALGNLIHRAAIDAALLIPNLPGSAIGMRAFMLAMETFELAPLAFGELH